MPRQCVICLWLPRNCGLDITTAPAAASFFLRANVGRYYDNTIFFRVVENFVIQGGDPTGTGKGGDSSFGGPFEDEIHSELKHTGAGILSMANAGKNTNKSQFFITLGPQPHLDSKHTVFGRISAGMSVIKSISSVTTEAGDRPTSEVRIITARLK